MKAKAMIYLGTGERLKTAETLDVIMGRLAQTPDGGGLRFKRLLDHGGERDTVVAAAAVVRAEAT